MSTEPAPEFRSAQFEFNDEHNRTLSGLADSMSTTAMLLQLMGVAFATLFGLQMIAVIKSNAGYIPAFGLAAGALLCLVFGYWTARASNSFRNIVASRNEDIWHLMNALGKLHHMYAFIRSIILVSLVIAVVGVALVLFGMLRGE